MVKVSEPRPCCPECGRIIYPECDVYVVSEDHDGYIDDEIPEFMPMSNIHIDIYSGLYCSSNCVLDAVYRGWPEYRSLTDDFSI